MSLSQRQRKLAKRFDLLDTDGDDVLRGNDFDLLANRLVAGFGQSPTSPKGEAVISGYRQFWMEFSPVDG